MKSCVYTVNFYNTKTKLAGSVRVSAKSEEMAFVLFCSGLAKTSNDVGDFCFMDYDYAQLWFKEWFSHYVGINITRGLS